MYLKKKDIDKHKSLNKIWAKHREFIEKNLSMYCKLL